MPQYMRHRMLQVKGAIRWNIEQGRSLGQHEVPQALATRASIRKQIDAWMETYRFFVLPSTQCVAFPLDIGEWPEEIAGRKLTRYLDWMQVCCEVTLLGLPVISIPCGVDPRTQMPVGAQIVGRRGADEELFRFAHAIEGALSSRIKLPHDIGGGNTAGGAKGKKKGAKK